MLKIIVPLTALVLLMPSVSSASVTSCGEEVQRGVASWYGSNFTGAQTQSGETFNPASYSAAHPTLPFGTTIKVTNMRNHKSVVVRVNDRGAFDKERVIDLSESAAEEIDMIDDGVAPVAIFKCNQ